MTNDEQKMLEKTAKAIVKEIIGDISDRSGLDGAWDEIDAETQKEIKDKWVDIIISKM